MTIWRILWASPKEIPNPRRREQGKTELPHAAKQAAHCTSQGTPWSHTMQAPNTSRPATPEALSISPQPPNPSP